jgi:molybdopterin converting factor subunit 1
MKLTVKYFAASREIVGTGEMVQELPDGATVGELRDVLFGSYPALSPLVVKFAVNRVYAPWDAELHDGDQVALIPPVGGG